MAILTFLLIVIGLFVFLALVAIAGSIVLLVFSSLFIYYLGYPELAVLWCCFWIYILIGRQKKNTKEKSDVRYG